jgi:hypothetical protein
MIWYLHYNYKNNIIELKNFIKEERNYMSKIIENEKIENEKNLEKLQDIIENNNKIIEDVKDITNNIEYEFKENKYILNNLQDEINNMYIPLIITQENKFNKYYFCKKNIIDLILEHHGSLRYKINNHSDFITPIDKNTLNLECLTELRTFKLCNIDPLNSGPINNIHLEKFENTKIEEISIAGRDGKFNCRNMNKLKYLKSIEINIEYVKGFHGEPEFYIEEIDDLIDYINKNKDFKLTIKGECKNIYILIAHCKDNKNINIL